MDFVSYRIVWCQKHRCLILGRPTGENLQVTLLVCLNSLKVQCCGADSPNENDMQVCRENARVRSDETVPGISILAATGILRK